MKNKPSDLLLEVAKEITFAKALASNDKFLRERALRRLKKWIASKSKASKGFTEDGFVRLWKGLYYNVWMSDKPLVQEEIIEGISNLLHSFIEFTDSLTFIKCFFRTLSDFWFGLDSHRFDKYLMFVRRFLRQCFVLLANYEWDRDHTSKLIDTFGNALVNAPLGLIMHISEIYLEELAKVSKGQVDEEIVFELIKPFGELMSNTSDVRLIKHISDYIFLYLLQQSDLGIKHEIKFQMWRKMGCPEGNINVLQEIEDNSGEKEEILDLEEKGNNMGLDARAGHVDVALPLIKFNPVTIIDHLTSLKTARTTTTKARKRLSDIINKYKTYNRGKYPLGINKVDILEMDNEEEIIEEAAFNLIEEEELEMNDKENSFKKKKMRAVNLPAGGKWLITAASSSEIPNAASCSTFNNKWEVTEEKNYQALTADVRQPQSNNLFVENSNKGIAKTGCKRKRKKFQSENLLNIEESMHDQFENSKNNGINLDRSNNWGSVPWDDKGEITIVIEPKEKSRTSFSPSKVQCGDAASLNGTEKKVDSARTPNSAKKVEFELNRNTVQDEEDYKRSLKKKPIIKIDGNNRRPQGVLKRTSFSSPINPFAL